MNKNWNDRADRDLFFTILSVKAIGIISGAEWTTIGNHMRTMGYGFTNEGCRQHFQGLRRTQHKTAASANVVPGLPPVMDPTQNPITRRPGPGRGRPRKNARSPDLQAGAAPAQPLPLPESADQQQFVQQQQAHHIQQPQQPLPQHPFPPQEPLHEQQHSQQGQAEPHISQPPLHEPVISPGQNEASPALTPPAPAPTPAPAPAPSAVPTSMPVPVSIPAEEQVGEPLDLQSASEEPDERASKRPRLEEEQTHETLDDEAVLALTGHEGQPNSYPSPTDFEYGEA